MLQELKYKNSRMSTVLNQFVVPPNSIRTVLGLQFSEKKKLPLCIQLYELD